MKLKARPTLPKRQETERVLKVIKLPEPTAQPAVDAERTALKPLWNKLVIASATVAANTFRHQRSFCLLSKVKVSAESERIKPEAEREAITLDHVWVEQTTDVDLSKEGSSIFFMARVISYQRADGSRSYGLRIVDVASPIAVISGYCAELAMKIAANDCAGSVTGAMQATINKITRELKLGISSTSNLPYLFGEYGRNSMVSTMQKVFRKMIRQYQTGKRKQALEFLKALALAEMESTQSHFANPLMSAA
jgi:hypothetical protein